MATQQGQFVTVAKVHTAKAPIVQGALEAEGITVVLQPNGFGAVYGFHSGPFGTEVKVPAEQVAQARALLEEVERDIG